MIKTLEDNLFYFLCCLIFFIFGAILLTQIETSDVIFFFSERRTPFADTFFTFFTKMGEELLYLIFFILFLFVRVRYAILIPLVGGCVTVLSYLTKTFFAQDRPLMFLENKGIADQINYVEGIQLHIGPTSFPSGHTMSAFALYGIIAFIISGKRIWGILLFVVALLIGVSRIYLVQHFFKDIYAGAWLGVLLAMAIYWAHSKIKVEDSHWLNQPIFGKRKIKPKA